jgi:serine/threonine protein phosphatase PrpC
MNPTCPFCGAALKPRARFCPTCGRPLPPAMPPDAAPVREADQPFEGALAGRKRITIVGESLDLRELINVVESAMRWWQDQLTSADAATRARAAESIEDLSRILHSLAQQLAQGRETVRITKRLPALRAFPLGCPACGHGNRDGAKYCQVCGTPLFGPAPQGGIAIPMPLRFRVAARTDQGRVRKNNQDAVYTGRIKLPGGGIAHLSLIADGMGGAKAGEQASGIAAEVTRIQLQSGVDGQRPPDDEAWQALLREAARAANRRVYEQSRANIDHKGMGTTLTVALIVGDRLYIASVGDSRAYLINAGGVTEDGATAAQLTSDHSLVARLVDIGQITAEQARTHPQRNLLYRSIGTDPSVEVDTFSEQLEPGDILLLCSDGLVNHVRDEEIARSVLEQSDPNRACEQLVALANERGGRDNISVVIVRVERGK